MNTDRPLVLIHSGDAPTDTRLREGLAEAFPNLGLRTASTDHELDSTLPDAEVLVAWKFPYERLRSAASLRWLQLLGAGLDSVSGLELPTGLPVTNIRGVFGGEMAEHAIAYILAYEKDLFGFRKLQRRHRWIQKPPGTLAGKTVGILGLGSIGKTVADRCRAMGMRVFGLKRTAGEPVEGVERVYSTGEIEQMLPECDYLVFVLPSTPETRGLIRQRHFSLMKEGVFLVSMGRGDVMDEAALESALRSGRIGGAALDVFVTEPLPDSSPLWDLESVYVTPHVSGINRPEDLLPVLKTNLLHYLRGEPLENLVDLGRGY